SEQTPPVCALGVRVDDEYNVLSAGGFLVQLLPGAEESVIDVIEKNITMISSVSQMIASGMTAEEIVRESLKIAASICVYTNDHISVEHL
ncbi:MAG: Hsp33 family molecular chaperone HslO, partial [Firmicutes bacterium]|nr:Hsp33 family molecular chaperone HslO [Bacillota bacterium]